MTSTFFGLNIALRGLNAQLTAINTTSHNVANANTDGFSRQTAVMTASVPFPVPSTNREVVAGQIGSGVDVSAIMRVRDAFMDSQYREQSASLGAATTQQSYFEQVESLVNEPSDSGINSLLNKMYAAWSDLSNEPSSYTAKAAVVQTGSVLADAIRRVGNQLNAMGNSADAEMDSKLTDVNSSLKEVYDLNKQIVMVKAAGDTPNDLMDRRDLLLDKISQVVPIGYRDDANGATTVWIGDQTAVGANLLVDGTPGAPDYAVLKRMPPLAPATAEQVQSTMAIAGTAASDVVPAGSEGGARALIDFKAEELDPAGAGGKGMAMRLEQMAVALLGEVNAAASTAGTAQTFFTTNGTGPVSQHLIVASALTTDPGTLESGATSVSGDGQNALAVVNLQSTPPTGFTIDAETITVSDWYQKMIAQLGIDSKQAQAMASNQQLLVDHIKTNRESASGVSLDEEATNLVRFQRAYQASARVMTAMDQMLDTIINNMGMVGR